MKRVTSKAVLLLLSFVTVFTSCKKDQNSEVTTTDESVVPATFSVDIPNAISSATTTKSTQGDTLKGNDIYGHLRTFINVGESAAEIVQKIMVAIRKNNINKAMEITYKSDDDGRMKHLVVEENVVYRSKNYRFKLTITDVLSESATDGGKALVVVWNTKPVDGIAILDFGNINAADSAKFPDFMAQIEYNEIGANGYDQEMVVSLSGYPLANPLVDCYSLRTLKMFVGRKGDVVDVYGNSNHPNARFFVDDEVGFNWAFVASSNRTSNIGIAEVALPPSTSTVSTHQTILKDYAMKTVFDRQIKKRFPSISQERVDEYLSNTSAPGYFALGGFKAAGTAPSTAYDDLKSRIDNLTPYQPVAVTNLSVAF